MSDEERMREQETLRLVIEKADRLERMSFTQGLLQGGRIGLAGERTEKGFVVWRQGPNEESLDAFLLTLRFFVQNNERVSFQNLEKLFEGLPIEDSWKDAVRGSRADLNEWLDQPSMLVIDGKKQTRREIYEVCMWGGFSHANPAKKAIYDRWTQGLGKMVVEMEFTGVVVQMLNLIFWFRDASGKTLVLLGERERN